MSRSHTPHDEKSPSGNTPDGDFPRTAETTAETTVETTAEHAAGPLVGAGTLEAVDAAQAEDGHAELARSSKRMEIVCASIAVAFCTVLILAARAIEVRNETGGVDPRWWPEVLGTFGLVLAALLLVVAIVRPPFDRDDMEAATREGWVRLAAAVALAVAFIFLWPVVGFLFITPPFLVVATYVFGGRGTKTVLLFPALMTAFLYLLFDTLLKVPL